MSLNSATKDSKYPKEKHQERPIKLMEAVIVFLIAISIIGYAAFSKAFPIAMGIFLALIFCCAYAMAALRISWDSLFESVEKTIASVLFGLIFCLSVGFISAAWIASGTIPFMLYWGLRLINPNMFLVVAFIITTIASFFTGQAWTMIPSLGLAFMGIATALGIPLPMAAAAVVSGCFIGDAASPICEVPTIASISAGSGDTIGTIKSMIPSFGMGILAGIVGFILLGFNLNVNAGQVGLSDSLMNAVANGFNLSPITLLPLIVVFALVFIKFPILPAVVIGAMVGVVEAIV